MIMKKKYLKFFIFIIWIILTSTFVSEIGLLAFLDRLPLRLSIHLTGPKRILSQYTKDGVYPKNYICLVGDSYAYGYGPWLYENAGSWGHPSYATQHILRKNLQRDIVSFGYPGYGNFGSSVTALAELEFLGNSYLRKVESPKHLLYFFYEGNDLVNNVIGLDRKGINIHDRNSSITSKEIRELIASEANKVKSAFNILDLSIISNLVKGLTKDLKLRYFPENQQPTTGISNLNHAKTKKPKKNDLLDVKSSQNIINISGADHLFSYADGPGLLLTDYERHLGLLTLKESLGFLKNHLKETEITVVFIPSALSIYKFSSEKITPAHSVLSNSNENQFKSFYPKDAWDLCEMNRNSVLEITKSLKLNYIDPVSELRKIAEVNLLHDPEDRLHFNRKGYEVFANFLTKELKKNL